MKLIRKMILTTMISSFIFIFIFIFTLAATNIMLKMKELSNQTITVLSDWNALDRITNDVLYYRLDSISRLESIEENWLRATVDLDSSFQKLRDNGLLKILPEDIAYSIEEAWYLWLFSNGKMQKGQTVFNNILHGEKTKDIIFNIDKITFYEKLLFLKEEEGSYSDKRIYQSFLSHMYVLDITSESFSIMLNDINRKIPDEINSYIYFMLLAGSLVLIVIVILVSLISSRRMIQPIIYMAKSVKEMSENDYPVTLPSFVDEEDELNIIQDGFNRMALRIHALYDESLKKEKDKRKAQFRALQYQINPHFLYNTLATLQMTANIHGDKKMADNIQSLSRLLRNTISKSDRLITVSEEMEIMADFINIIQIRYKNRLIFKSSLTLDISDLFIPSLIMQPLLENAILHGLSAKLNKETESAILEIGGYLESGHLILTVTDNGKGIDAPKIEEILAKGNDHSNESSVHIGLKNINDRIILLHGLNYGVTIDSIPGEFTCVSLCLPILTEEEDAEITNC